MLPAPFVYIFDNVHAWFLFPMILGLHWTNEADPKYAPIIQKIGI